MTIEPALAADSLVNLFGAGGALVVARQARRADPHGPVTRRMVPALQIAAALLVVRVPAWLTGNRLLGGLEHLLAVVTPLYSLTVAEGLLRQHAPRWLKIALLAGPLALMLALPGLPERLETILVLVLVSGGYAAVAALLWLRSEGSLTPAENRTVRRVLLAMMVLAGLAMTDFHSLWPQLPVRLGALGALLVLYVGLGSGNVHVPVRARLLTLALFFVIALMLGLCFTVGQGADALLSASAASYAGLLFAALFSEARGAHFERHRPAEPVIGARTPGAFVSGLAAHPLLGGSRVLSGALLEEVNDPSFVGLMAAQGVLRRSAHPWGRPQADDGVERALSLMMAYEATHLALLTAEPLRIMVVQLPGIASDERTESEIELVRLVGALLHAREDTA